MWVCMCVWTLPEALDHSVNFSLKHYYAYLLPAHTGHPSQQGSVLLLGLLPLAWNQQGDSRAIPRVEAGL